MTLAEKSRFDGLVFLCRERAVACDDRGDGDTADALRKLAAAAENVAADNARLRRMWSEAGKRLERAGDQVKAEGQWMLTVDRDKGSEVPRA